MLRNEKAQTLIRRFVLVAMVATGCMVAVPWLAQPAAASPASASASTQHEQRHPLVWAQGDVDDFTFSSFEGEYTLGRDEHGNSTLRSVERFVAEFPEFDQNRGIVRAIPQGSGGVNWQTDIESVTDADGNPVSYEDSDVDDGFILVEVGTDEFVHGTQTYVITYTQRDVVRAFDDTEADELYWDAPGTGFAQPFESAQMRFVVPQELSRAMLDQHACYVGEYGDETRCDVSTREENGAVVYATEALALAPAETISLAIAFESGTFTTPEIPASWPVFTWVPGAVIAGLLGTLVAGFVMRGRSAGDATGRGIVVPQYTPPKGVGMFVAGDLIGRTSQAMAASIISLAVRRHLRIIASGPDGDERYSIELVSRDGIAQDDEKIVDGLFGRNGAPGTVRDLSTDDTELSKKVAEWVSAAPRQSIAEGYRRSKTVRGASIIVLVAILLGLAGVALMIGSIAMYGTTGWSIAAGVAGIIGIVVAILLVLPRKALTRSGAELKEYLDGLRRYIELAEEDRLRMLQSPSGADRVVVGDAEVVHVYEKLLPYAVLMGREKEWSSVLGETYDHAHAAPDWYVGSGTFQAAIFASSISSFSSSSGSTPWSSSAMMSSTGGSMGGGFAGGGGGGGGGGGR